MNVLDFKTVQLARDDVPLANSNNKLGAKFQALPESPSEPQKDTIVQLLDRCFADYEEAKAFLSAPLENGVSLELDKSYCTQRTLDIWHGNLPFICAKMEALGLSQLNARLRRML